MLDLKETLLKDFFVKALGRYTMLVVPLKQ